MITKLHYDASNKTQHKNAIPSSSLPCVSWGAIQFHLREAEKNGSKKVECLIPFNTGGWIATSFEGAEFRTLTISQSQRKKWKCNIFCMCAKLSFILAWQALAISIVPSKLLKNRWPMDHHPVCREHTFTALGSRTPFTMTPIQAAALRSLLHLLTHVAPSSLVFVMGKRLI